MNKHKNSSSFKIGQVPWNKGKKWKKDPAKIVRGVHLSPGTEFKPGCAPWNKGKKMPQKSGANHPNWIGDKVSYVGVHAWIYRNFGQPSRCDKCGVIEAKRFEWHNLSGEYKRDRNDWERLCSMCHHQHHKNWIKANEKIRHGKAV